MVEKKIEEEHELNGENEEDWELRMKEMEKDLERRKVELAQREGEDPETRRLVQEMMQRFVKKLERKRKFRETELKRARSEHESLRSKLSQMESKLIVGGENMLEKAEMQARMLEDSNQWVETG